MFKHLRHKDFMLWTHNDTIEGLSLSELEAMVGLADHS
jgi:hypothetical protein